ncbi:MAG TPA: SurA N-terminal domain-containing protein [Xanthomonadaceae bacterium]|nr:SurA N-terminal domain-containing protein [Xanthomonadaceae bacterium]
MLQKLRERTTGWVAIVIVGLIVIAFAFFGVENYFQSQATTHVARVGDSEIGQEEFRQRFEQYRQQMRQMMGDRYDARALAQPEVKRQLLEQMIEERLVREQAARHGMVVSPQQMQSEIAGIAAFQVDGRFDADRYRMILAGQNMTPSRFQAEVVRDLATRTLPSQLVESAFVTEAYVDAYLRLRDQRREFRYAVIPAPEAGEIGEITDADLEAYHQENADEFVLPAQVTLEYLQLSPDSLQIPTEVDEATLLGRYEEQKARYVEPEARLASHILVSVPADADADAVQAARERADAIAAQARAADADFSALAREHSQDLGSRAVGGELGWIERGMLDEAFEAALFGLETGAVSDPVKSSEGWHLILVQEVRQPREKSFADVRAELEAEYLDSERERLFSDLSGQLVDMVYRDPTTLATAADALDLPIQRVGPFSQAGGAGIAAQPAVTSAAFSDEVLVDRSVSDLIELDDGSVVVIQVVEHQPQSTLPLDQVRSLVEDSVRRQRIEDLGRSRAQEALQALESGDIALETLAGERGWTFEQVQDVGRMGPVAEPGVLAEAFILAPTGSEGAGAGSADLGGGRHALIEVIAVRDGDPAAVDLAQRQALREQLGRLIGGLETRAFIEALRDQIEVTVVEERL